MVVKIIKKNDLHFEARKMLYSLQDTTFTEDDYLAAAKALPLDDDRGQINILAVPFWLLKEALEFVVAHDASGERS
jgi:hypothetical protein